jgi:mannitol-1-phosphate 5-dehydrogenase
VKLVQFGAGNIGRSFIGQVFSRAGWEVVFIDIDERLVSLLNEKRFYTVAIKREGREDELRTVGPVRAVSGENAAAAAFELASADLAVTSVGKNALTRILPVIAGGLKERRKRSAYHTVRPLDIIIAENAREAPALFRTILSQELGPDYPLDALVGIVETSIGKMVPIMRNGDLVRDPLLLFAEAYETLIVDKRGFRAAIPADVTALYPVEPIEAYVDRKLFIHNLGHAAAAYLGCRVLARDSAVRNATIPQVLSLPGIEAAARRAMNESAEALLREYPGVFSREDLAAHIEDLLARFKNTALGDTVYRVGRDLRRKLGRDDRLTGAMLLCAKHGLSFNTIAEVYCAALDFAAPGEDGALFLPDLEFREEYRLGGVLTDKALSTILAAVSGLNREAAPDSLLVDVVAHLRIPEQSNA